MLLIQAFQDNPKSGALGTITAFLLGLIPKVEADVQTTVIFWFQVIAFTIPINDKALEGDIEETQRLVTDMMNEKIDIPEVQEEVELMMFDGFTRFAAAAVAWFLERKRAA
jgi:hypothetical protein